MVFLEQFGEMFVPLIKFKMRQCGTSLGDDEGDVQGQQLSCALTAAAADLEDFVSPRNVVPKTDSVWHIEATWEENNPSHRHLHKNMLDSVYCGV